MFSHQLLSHPESFQIDENHIWAIFEYIAQVVAIPQKGILNIAFLSDEEIRSLNHQYRGIDSTTDVLSFHYFDDFSNVWDDEVVGEIIMSESRIRSQSVDHGHSEASEFETLAIHGILHILGYDHEDDDDYKAMWQIEKPIRINFWLGV